MNQDIIEDEAAQEVAAATPAAAPEGISEEAITEKVKAGLTRGQAIEVITTQAAWDAKQAKDAKPAKARK